MGGGSSLLSASSNYSLNEPFNHTFNALMPLSGCGDNSIIDATKQIYIPTIIMSGSHDCLCPATEYADVYYKCLPDKTCKYLAIINNGTHCHFEEEGFTKDRACELVEESACNGKPYNHISEDYQHEIVINYFTSFMYATLYQNDSKQSLNSVATQLKNDENNGVMYNISIDC